MIHVWYAIATLTAFCILLCWALHKALWRIDLLETRQRELWAMVEAQRGWKP